MSKKTNIPKDAFRVRWSDGRLLNGLEDKNRRGIGWVSRNYPYRIRVLWDGMKAPIPYYRHHLYIMRGKIKP